MNRTASAPELYYLVPGNVLAASDHRLRAPGVAILGVCRDGESARGWRPMADDERPATRKAAGNARAGESLAGMEVAR